MRAGSGRAALEPLGDPVARGLGGRVLAQLLADDADAAQDVVERPGHEGSLPVEPFSRVRRRRRLGNATRGGAAPWSFSWPLSASRPAAAATPRMLHARRRASPRASRPWSGEGRDGRSPGSRTRPARRSATTLAQAATTDIRTPISSKRTLEGGLVGQTVSTSSLEDKPGIYFVSAQLDGKGLEGDGDIATWATESPGAKAIYALDDLAREYSDTDARNVANVSMDNDGVAESRDCAQR